MKRCSYFYRLGDPVVPEPRNARRTRRGVARWLSALVVMVISLGIYLGSFGWKGQESPTITRRPKGPGKGEPSTSRPMTEAERAAYVQAFVRVQDVVIEPDKDPDDKPVPGLHRVKGRVINTGKRSIHRVVFTVVPKDASGSAMAAYMDDVVHKGGPLEAGQERAFSFTIPERPGFSGQFEQAVQ